MRVFVARAGEPPSWTPVYRLRSSGRAIAWPTTDGTNLGMAGAWNALWRAGHVPAVVSTHRLPDPRPGDLLFVQADGPIDDDATRRALAQWTSGGARVVCTGAGEYWRGAFPSAGHWECNRIGNPYAAIGVDTGSAVQLLAPPRWRYTTTGVERAAGAHRLVAVHGERQTPSRALTTPLDRAPLFIVEGAWTFINGDPFAALQAWLQGQEDLGPWLAWRHRLFWLDEWIAWLLEALQETMGIDSLLRGPGVPTLPAVTVVLRHDLDDSRDDSYLEEEVARGLVATHGILRDRNASFWQERLARATAHESALHYATGARDLLAVARRPFARRGSVPYRALAGGGGLRRQVAWASRSGVGVRTLLRHLAFLRYPECVVALDDVFTADARILGSSSLFRAQVLRWGAEHVDGSSGTIGEWPDPMFPYWMPFRVAHAGDRGRLLRGWESTSMMELEPDFAAQLIDTPSPFPQRVLTLGYHPAHAAGQTFAAGGSLQDFRRVLDAIQARDVTVSTLESVYRTVSEAP